MSINRFGAGSDNLANDIRWSVSEILYGKRGLIEQAWGKYHGSSTGRGSGSMDFWSKLRNLVAKSVGSLALSKQESYERLARRKANLVLISLEELAVQSVFIFSNLPCRVFPVR
jgi:hypothetical protein